MEPRRLSKLDSMSTRGHALRRFRQLYFLELLVVIAGIAVSGGAYLLFDRVLAVSKDQLAYVSVANAGMLFILGHAYSRLKDRRDAKRKRAQELFLDWHSKDVRESRIFVNRWTEVHGKAGLPTLSALERDAAGAYHRRYDRAIVLASGTGGADERPLLHALDDPEEKEVHFFRVYQFFERWALLVKNSDVDHATASAYMSSYKSWYLSGFIKPWAASETDVHIKKQLEEILRYVGQDR
jgi:hypothetical protein